MSRALSMTGWKPYTHAARAQRARVTLTTLRVSASDWRRAASRERGGESGGSAGEGGGGEGGGEGGGGEGDRKSVV